MRRRDISRWSPGIQYSSVAEFCQELACDGLHTIQLGGTPLDLYAVDRGADSTLITFQHRVSERTTYPKFVGERISAELGVNLISVSDPTVSGDGEIRLGWYLGNRDTGHLKKHLLPVLERLGDLLGGQRTIFWGNSGGGYAAIDYAQHFAGSIAFTVNPRLGFADGLSDDLVKFLRLGHQAKGRTPFNRLRREYANNLWETVEGNADFIAAMYHNSGDTGYYDLNHKKFVDCRRSDLQLAERIDFDGEGHVPIPRSKLVEILRTLTDTSLAPAVALQKAGFSSL